MAITESGILAQISATEARLTAVIAGIGVAGDYSDGDVSVNRAGVIGALEKRLERLNKELSRLPAESIATADISIAGETMEDSTEYVEET